MPSRIVRGYGLWLLSCVLSASDALIDTDFAAAALYAPLPAMPLAHGALPTGWADNSTWSKADCTYAASTADGAGFLHISGASKGRIQFWHQLAPFAVRSAFRLTLRARSAAPTSLRISIARMAAPYRTIASTTIPLTVAWQDVSRVIAGGPGEEPLGLLVAADSPGSIDLASLRLAAAELSEYVPSTTVPVMRTDRDWYPQRQRELVAQLVAEQPKVVVMGDSLTAAWAKEGAASWTAALAPLHATAYGIGGDRVEHLAWRLRNSGIGTTFTPQVAVVLIGVNNLATDTPDDIAQGTGAVLDYLAQASPHTKVLLLGLFPTGEKSDHPNRALVREVNARYAELARSRKVAFADLGAQVLAADGRLPPETSFDALHFTAAGYALYARALVPEIGKLLAP